MYRLSINQLTTYRSSLEEDVFRCARMGIEGIGLWREKIQDYGEEKTRELLRELDIQPSNLLWAGGFTGSEGRSYRESVWDAAAAIRLAGFLECPTLVLYSGGRGGHTRRHARRILYDAIAALLPIAEQEGVQLALEPMHPSCFRDWTVFDTLAETLQLLEDVNHPLLKLVLDTYQLAEQPDLPERIGQWGEQIAVVHLADGRLPFATEQNRCSLGDGSIDLSGILLALAEIEYRGFLDLELFGEDVESIDYDALISSAQATIEDHAAMTV